MIHCMQYSRAMYISADNEIHGLGLLFNRMATIAIYMVGEVVADDYDIWHHHTFRHLPLLSTDTYGYVQVASFLKETVGHYVDAMF